MSSTTARRRRRESRALRAAALLALSMVAVASAAAGVLFGSLRSVDDAPARVRAIDERHGAQTVAVSEMGRVARAVVAVEDERFYEHGPVDAVAIGRVALTTLRGDTADPGGSTITQQLAKTLYVEHPETFYGRVRAIGLAAKLERRFSKAEILSMYLNAIYFGHGFYGVHAASRGFFGKSVRSLTWSQATLLAGLAQSPSVLDPFLHRRRAVLRQRDVLAQLVDTGVLSKRAARTIGRAPLGLGR